MITRHPFPGVEGPTFPSYPPTVPAMIRHGRRSFGANDCLITPSTRVTFAELDERSAGLAQRLVELGVGKGSRVGLLFPNGPDWLMAWVAAARLGAVTVPVSTFYQAPELARFMRHADVQYLLAVPAFLHHDYVARLESAAPELSGHGPGPLHLPSLPHLRRVVVWGGAAPSWADRLQPGPADGGGTELPMVVQAMEDDVSPGDVLLVTYTSGSTGDPKGVVHSHGTAIRHASNLAALAGIGEHSRIWTPMPLCWVGGLVFGLLRALVAGGCLVTQESFEPGTALRLLDEAQVTDVAAWPGALKAMCEHPDFSRTGLGSIRSGFPEAMAPARRPADPDLAVGSLGMSETCGPHTSKTAAEEASGAPPECRGTFGHQVPGTEHRIVDPETGRDLPDGEEGEVLVRGYNMMLGLYKRERSEVFDADGWYRTGDRGYFRDGWFFFTGRQSDLIKVGGSNVAPAEVERCLMAHPDVTLAFVVGVPDGTDGQKVVAVVVPRHGGGGDDGSPLSGDALRARLRAELSSYKVPSRVLSVTADQIPWLASQKVDRRALGSLAEKLLSDEPAAGR